MRHEGNPTTASEEKISPWRSELSEGLESPFLDHELLTGQGKEEWQAHLGELEEESTFLSAFEQPWAHPPWYQEAELVPRSEAEDYEPSAAEWSPELGREQMEDLAGEAEEQQATDFEGPLEEAFNVQEEHEVAATRPTLKQGSRGKSVQELQVRLQAVSKEKIKADGKFGPDTRAAVIRFQESHRLNPDGVVERRTWDALLPVSGGPALNPPTLQRLMNANKQANERAGAHDHAGALKIGRTIYADPALALKPEMLRAVVFNMGTDHHSLREFDKAIQCYVESICVPGGTEETGSLGLERIREARLGLPPTPVSELRRRWTERVVAAGAPQRAGETEADLHLQLFSDDNYEAARAKEAEEYKELEATAEGEDFEAESLEPEQAEAGDQLFESEEHPEPLMEGEVLTLPAGLPGLPNDATLRGQLQAIGTAEARALDAAFAVFGDPARFNNRLPPALNAAFESLRGGPKQRFRVHVARLGAEAFILDTPIEPGNRYDNFVDHPDRLGSSLTLADQRNWVHFAMRRLHQISPIVVKPPTHRRQMGRAAALFGRFQSELTSKLPIFDDKALPLAYRTLTVQILWRHYQALQDLVLEAAAKGGLNWAVASKDWDADLRSAAITREVDDADSTVPTFRLTATLYRDYFRPSAASDIGYGHFTATPIPFTGHGPDIPFRIVFRRRAEQRAFVERLRRERPADSLPKLHDTASWQAWARETWDSPLLQRETKLEVILKHVSGYFEAFTVHAPHDIREGCSVPNYLIRAFPRAITGSLVHDCFVYAVRWLHVLGRLLTRGSTPSGIANPRIFLIEMPAHVGVMIRADTTTLNRHVVISINNKHAEIHERDAGESDKAAAEIVVQDMYRGPRTPFALRPLTSNPADAKTLWNEVCKLSERKLALPYKDSSYPPHLRYLRHNALLASISKEHSDAVRASWATMHQRLEAAKDGRGNVLPARVIDEIRRHGASFEKANQAAKTRLDKEREPLIKEINDDLIVNQQRVPKGVWIIATNPSVPLISAVEAYRKALEEAIRSRNLPAIDPAEFFPEDDFVAAVE